MFIISRHGGILNMDAVAQGHRERDGNFNLVHST